MDNKVYSELLGSIELADEDFYFKGVELTNENIFDESKKLQNCTDVKKLQYIINHLYDLLDDVDTLTDMCKNDDKTYRFLAEKLQKQKNEVIDSDGYELFIK